MLSPSYPSPGSRPELREEKCRAESNLIQILIGGTKTNQYAGVKWVWCNETDSKRGERGELGLTNPDVHLQFGCGASSEILIILSLTRDLSVLIRDPVPQWSESTIYLMAATFHLIEREGETTFLTAVKQKTFQLGELKATKTLFSASLMRRIHPQMSFNYFW